MSTVDIERESLEAHVELCAERYSRMEEKFDNVEKRLSTVESVLVEIKGVLVNQNHQRQKQLIGWAIGVIGFLATTCVGLVYMLLNI